LLLTIVFLADQINDLTPPGDESFEAFLLRRFGGLGSGLDHATKFGDHLRIDRIRLGQLSEALCETSNAAWLNNSQGNLMLMKNRHQQVLITPRWLP
jgi:hypothetical protein